VKRRSNAGLFQRLLEAGKKTTYHGKIRTRGGKRTPTVRKGKQTTYKGVRIIPVEGEFETSLDSSRFETTRQAKRFIDSWQKGRNPASYRGQSIANLERMLIYANARAYADDWLERDRGRRDVAAIEHALKNARKREAKRGNPSKAYEAAIAKHDRAIHAFHKVRDAYRARQIGDAEFLRARKAYDAATAEFDRAFAKEQGNPKGTKGRFERCVKAVSERGGAYDPRAVCGAQEKKYRGNPTIYQALAEKLGRAPTNAELRAEVARIKEEALIDTATKGKLGWQRRRSARNPADAAMAVSEEFHGRKVKAMIPVQQKRHYHKYLAELGELRKLIVHSRDGKSKVTLRQFDGAMLCSNEDRNQLFIVDGDQSVDLKDFGIKNPHEVETLGEVVTIDYFTDKEHLGDEGGEAVYTHKFRSTNDNGKHKTIRMANNPDLIYYLRDQHLEFSGGSYEIRAEGIDK